MRDEKRGANNPIQTWETVGQLRRGLQKEDTPYEYYEKFLCGYRLAA